MTRKKHTLTYGDALQMSTALHAIKKTKFNKPTIEFHLNVSENREKLDKGLKAFHDTNNELLEQYGEKTKEGDLDMAQNQSGNIEVKLKDPKAYQKDYETLVETTKDYMLFSLAKKHFDKTDVDNETITSLIPLLS